MGLSCPLHWTSDSGPRDQSFLFAHAFTGQEPFASAPMHIVAASVYRCCDACSVSCNASYLLYFIAAAAIPCLFNAFDCRCCIAGHTSDGTCIPHQSCSSMLHQHHSINTMYAMSASKAVFATYRAVAEFDAHCIFLAKEMVSVNNKAVFARYKAAAECGRSALPCLRIGCMSMTVWCHCIWLTKDVVL